MRNFSDGINQKAFLSIETAIPTTQRVIEMTTPITQELIKTTTPIPQKLLKIKHPTTGKFAEVSTSEVGVSRDLKSISSRETTGLRTRTSLEMQKTPESSFKGTASSKSETTTSNTRVEGSKAAVYTTHRRTESDRVSGAAGRPDTHATYSTGQPGQPAERTTKSKMVASTSDMYESSTKTATPSSPVTIGLERDHTLGTTSMLDNLHEERKGAKSNNFHPSESELLLSVL